MIRHSSVIGFQQFFVSISQPDADKLLHNLLHQSVRGLQLSFINKGAFTDFL